jgi:hypothetical protein
MNSAADRIRQHLDQVAHLRARSDDAATAHAVREIKVLQARRFEATYTDLLQDPRHRPATRFFLDELYGDHDFAQRDAQFARIAGAIERLFPEAVAQLAVDMAELHAVTEQLDATLGTHWKALPALSPAPRYVAAWRQTGTPAQRQQQLRVVLQMGRELQRLTRMKSLRLALRMMRGPALAGGLGALHAFLERGFEAFTHMGDAQPFLAAVEQRESRWMDVLFDDLRAAQALAPLIGDTRIT